jgi:hypothetical protein
MPLSNVSRTVQPLCWYEVNGKEGVEMEVRLGESVFGIGGKQVGEVDGLIVDAGTKRARAILVDTGLLNRAQHMVAVSAIAHSDERGLHLDTTGKRAGASSPVVESEEVAFSQRVEPPTEFVPAAGVGGPVIADNPAVPGEYPDEKSFFDIAPLDPPPVEIESNLGENEVKLDKRTDVRTADGHKVGEAVAFELGDMGLVDRVTVAEGFLLKRSVNFPLAEIGEFGTNEIHLRISKDEAEKR